MTLKDWINGYDRRKVNIGALREIIRIDEEALRHHTCMSPDKLKEEVQLLRELLSRAIISQGWEQ